MSRAIRFRAWDKESECFIPTGFIKLIGNGSQEYLDKNLQRIIPDKTKAYDIQLYTGLKDKNGKEGYFDDLVQWGTSIYQVMWDSRQGIAKLIKCSGIEVFPSLLITEIEKGEIIGNIHENPELLEVK